MKSGGIRKASMFIGVSSIIRVAAPRWAKNIGFALCLACAAWFGQTFNVVENGRFLAHGCPRAPASLQRGCKVGAKQWQGPLVTFS